MKLHLTIPLISTALFLTACSKKEEPAPKETTAATVEVVQATSSTIQSWTFAEGNARATRREYLNFENSGRIIHIGENLREGSSVTKGQLLVNQDQRSLQADVKTSESSVVEAETKHKVAAAELEQSLTELKLTQTTFKRFEELLKRQSASQQEFDEAQAKVNNANSAVARSRAQIDAAKAQIDAAKARLTQSQVALSETEIRSPIDGIIARLNVVVGFYMTPSIVRTDSEESLLQTIPVLVIDPRSFEITVDIPPSLADMIKAGQIAYIHPQGKVTTPNEEFSPTTADITGEIYSVTPSVSPGRRTIQAKIRTTKGANLLQDGTFTTVWIETLKRENTTVVPLGAFIYRENEPYVFIVNTQTNQAELRSVTLGISNQTSQEILSGINPGDQIVTKGRYQLSDGTDVIILKNTDSNK